MLNTFDQIDNGNNQARNKNKQDCTSNDNYCNPYKDSKDADKDGNKERSNRCHANILQLS